MRRSSFRAALFELFSSMRFAISLLVIIAIASVIGTVLKQNEASNNYVIEFGAFWANIFDTIGLFDVYHAGWFLGILGFLILSTSLCIWRQWPSMLRDIRQYREHAKDNSLRAMAHHAEFAHSSTPDSLAEKVQNWWQSQGYRIKQVNREDGLMLAAKKGSLQRLGYLFAHVAIVVICIGGLLDGNVVLQAQRWLGLKTLQVSASSLSEIPASARLGTGNFSFRADMNRVAEGSSRDYAIQNEGKGFMIQELPFTIKLKQFHVEHYSTGQPKLFASDIEVTEKATGKVTTGTVKVNHPLIVDGIAIYQATFGDGGSPLEFKVWPLLGGQPSAIKGQSLSTVPVSFGPQAYSLEFDDLRVFNIENLGDATAGNRDLDKVFQDARAVRTEKKLKNVGPSITFKLRDAQGQAHEYRNYMQPFEEEGRYYLLSGVRAAVADPFAFVRFPLDKDFKLDTYMRLKDVMLDPAFRDEIVSQTSAQLAQSGNSPQFKQQFEQGLRFVLSQFASGGFQALERFLKERVPADKREAVAQPLLKSLQGAAFVAMDIAQKHAGQSPIEVDADGKQYRFLMDSLTAMSAGFEYGSPVYLQMVDFKEVKSSGFQLTRSPGKNLVYLGSLLLVLGIICMFYVRENRMWLRINDRDALFAFSSNRRDALTDAAFKQQLDSLSALIGKEPS
ncbi:cytochrome c biogenesis protein ResB [Burkholderiaceae bacterium DAT-1]|nr:cytochrome c biogenesis protein ResB [Burkholderiaceae bacterium DAT-1]